MIQYDGELKLPTRYLIEPPKIDRTSGEYLTYNGVHTFACGSVLSAELVIVTTLWSFCKAFDSGISFNIQPKMKALEIAEKARDAILTKKFEQIIKNSLLICKYVLTYPMGTWWGILVTFVSFIEKLEEEGKERRGREKTELFLPKNEYVEYNCTYSYSILCIYTYLANYTFNP
ncbi:putative phosphoglycerate mutase (2,3-diphosphoglycerate-independent) [Rosa chinensis]|uniref:Putative phosphoglycerate mutase (2,3-diphosphoglycerate-independent) n=1 Tax=Rosa chinensis TaxID=74649 RepID=A0A2P6S138_ROSCH|nr:putative phosphoglycerate mutase (2,3-diphosphoglycerate-independent) [Rosa chinensis]